MALSESPLAAQVRDLGVQFLDNDVDISGQDAATSVELPDDKTFWIFGDTLTGPFDTVRNLPLTEVLSNTGAIVPKQDISDGIREFTYRADPDGKRARQLIQFEPPEHKSTQRLWAIHGTYQRGHLYLYYHRITMDQKLDVFETFQLDGMGIAKADENYSFERLVAPDGTHEFWKGDEPGFGVFIQEIDGWLYLWGSVQPEEKSSGEMYLARVRPANLENLEAYEYLVAAPTLEHPGVKPEWSKTWVPTATLFDNVPNEMSAAWNDYLGRYVSLSTYRRENILVIRTAPEMWGPWSDPEVVYRPERTNEKSLFNAGKEHPEFAREGGKVTYMTFIDSEVYVPHLIEITYT